MSNFAHRPRLFHPDKAFNMRCIDLIQISCKSHEFDSLQLMDACLYNLVIDPLCFPMCTLASSARVRAL